MAISREDVAREVSVRHALLRRDGSFVTAKNIDKELLTPVQRGLLALGNLPRAGTAQYINRAMSEMRLGTPEPSADKGHFRYYPRGVLVRRLIRDWLEAYVSRSTGGVEVETPTLYRWGRERNELHDLAGTFHQLLYHVTDGNDERSHAVMRYGADPGYFGLMKTTSLSPDQFPFHVYELATAYRRHKTGEVASILRARAFTFYDHHALCSDRSQAREEFMRIVREQYRFLTMTERTYEWQLVVVEDMLDYWTPILTTLTRELKIDACVTILSKAKHYYSLVSNFADPHGSTTLQIQVDHETPQLFNLANQSKLYPEMSLLHMSAGALERWLVSFLLDGLNSGRTATLPLWLSPTQVRVIPHNDALIDEAWRLHGELTGAGVRADVDDRKRSLGSRLAAAQREWVPWVAVIGHAERESGNADVLDRQTGTRVKMSGCDLAALINERTERYPRRGGVEPSVAARPAYGA